MTKERFSEEEKKKITAAIAAAEKNTSGEIRVHIDSTCKVEVMDMAKAIFFKLKMNETKLSNGVLIYLSLDDRKFAILGDKGIDNVTASDFWDDIKSEMLNMLKQGQIIEAIEKGVAMAGEALKEHFPYQDDDINELDDEISFGN